MDDLISRQAAIKLLKAKFAEIFFKETAEKNIEKWLNELPPVQSEQKTGRWVCLDDDYLAYGCSECKSVSLRESNYCPECGAYMKGENND